MENPRHLEALRMLNDQPKRLRTEYVACCILRIQQMETMEQIINATLQNALHALSITTASPQLNSDQQSAVISDLPDTLIHAMDDL